MQTMSVGSAGSIPNFYLDYDYNYAASDENCALGYEGAVQLPMSPESIKESSLKVKDYSSFSIEEKKFADEVFSSLAINS
jgi:hypothetical protein